VAQGEPVAISGDVIEVATTDTINTEGLEVLVPVVRARQPELPATNEADDGVLVAIADEVMDDAALQDPMPVALLDTANVGQPLALPAVPALQTVNKVGVEASGDEVPVNDGLVKSDSAYYIQAGVFANVKDAERLAVDIVLVTPREEVHVKPLKDTEMYRVTLGPIIQKAHATDVSGVLLEAGIDNYTVKVKEL